MRQSGEQNADRLISAGSPGEAEGTFAGLQEMRGAQRRWSNTPLFHRLKVVRRFRHLLVEQAECLAEVEAVRSQRSAAEVLSSELLPLADACRFLERNAREVLAPRRVGFGGRPLWLSGARSVVRREPWGVVLIIAPSNYPYLLPGVQLLQALVAGNAVLLKPGVGGFAAARELLRLLETAGLFPSTLFVTGEDPGHGQKAIEAGVDKVVFTGSANTGRKVLAQLLPRVIPATMELSGCDAVFVRADADVEMAVQAAAFGLRLNQGRTCIAPRRAYVARSVATEFEGRLSQVLASVPRTLVPDQTSAFLRPLLSQALQAGAHLLSGRIHLNGSLEGPLVVAGLPPSSRLLRDDFFAPVMSVVTVADDAESLILAAQSPYALGTTIFSRDITAARQLASQVRAGVVVINDMIAPTADPRLPFGGRGLSGFGSTRGPEGLLEMTTPKVVCEREGTFRPHYEPAAPEDAALFAAYLNAVHGGDWRRRCSGIMNLLSGLRTKMRKLKTKRGNV